jgi:tetratricopeptide (TPR) repeat protein/TolB-like protein/tRNA A-37 threonylcarbamoyl transferase component Bud32
MAELHPIPAHPAPRSEPLSGSIAGRFLISDRLGKGGMGEVYRAEDTKLKRTVALKRLAPDLRADSVYRHRFLEEAARASRFTDAHIAALYDVLEERDEMFLVMEYVNGETLRQRLRRPMPLQEFFEIATQCAEALAAAHERGIVHCDIKPENIMLTSSAQVKILDFGVAKHLPRSDQSSTVDRTGTMGGTPAYMSPEVLLEKMPDGRADVFSLGVVFYEALTGHHPFLASSFVATTDRIRKETPASIRIFNREVPEGLEALVSKALAKEPGQRYASARDLLEDLRLLQAGLTPSKLRVLPPPAETKSRKRRWTAATVSTIAALLLIAAYLQPQIRRWLHLGKFSAPIQLAVLPFAPTGDDPGAKAFCDGLTETLTAKLTQLTGNYPLQVVPSSEIRAEGVTSVEQARRDFGVGLVLEGSLHGSGNQVRVTYSLVDAETRRQLHADTVDAAVTDAFAVEDRVVDGVLGMLGLEIQGNDRVVLAAHGTGDPSAYDQYLRGRGYLLEYHQPENIDKAIAAFNRALTLDTKYAKAYAALGEAYWQGYQEGQHAGDWMEKAGAACDQAVAAAPNLADGYACLGRVYRGTGEYEKAVAQFQKATALDPTSDDAYRGLADTYQKLNRPAEAEATYRRAISLRPQYWAGYSWLGAFYWQQARYDDAIKMFKEVVTLAPDNYRGYSNLGAIYAAQARYQEAIQELEHANAIRPSFDADINLGTAYFCLRKFHEAAQTYEEGLKLNRSYWQLWGNLGDTYYWSPDKRPQAADAYREAIRLADEKLRVNPRDASILAFRATYLAMVEDKQAALESLRQAVSIAPKDADVQFRAALVYNHFGDTKSTLDWLQRALISGVAATWVHDTPDFDHLRGDPRLAELLHAH